MISDPATPPDCGLFDLPDGAAVPPVPVERLSADRRRTLRQSASLAKGRHPLGGRLHPEAAPPDDRAAPGRRCGNCWYRRLTYTNGNKLWPKCHVDVENPTDTNPQPVFSLRLTHSASTDCRGWWPGCTDHTYGDQSLSDDAARFVPTDLAPRCPR